MIHGMEITEKVPVRQKRFGKNSTERMVVKYSVLIAAVLLLVALIDSNTGFFSSLKSSHAARAKWQAVFLVNDQVYFGHLSPHGMGYFVLKDSYYIQSVRVPLALPPQAEGQAQPEQQFETRNELVKVTGDLHEPENEIFIPKEQILFWQNLRSDSAIVRTIVSQGN